MRWGHMTKNSAKLAGSNPQPKAEESHPFTEAEIDLVAEELEPKYGPMVVFASEVGLRQSEWLSVEWRDVDRTAGVVLVERTSPTASRRARQDRPEPSSCPVVDKGAGGSGRDSSPSRRAACVSRPPGRSCRPEELPPVSVETRARRRGDPAATDLRRAQLVRHLGARCRSVDLDSGRYMGTSVEMIDRTYGHLAQGAEETARAKLNAAYLRRLGHERGIAGSGGGRAKTAATPHGP